MGGGGGGDMPRHAPCRALTTTSPLLSPPRRDWSRVSSIMRKGWDPGVVLGIWTFVFVVNYPRLSCVGVVRMII